MTQVKLRRTRQEVITETVEIDFPLYVAAVDDLDDGRVSYTSHYRISADGRKLKVTEWSGHTDLDYEIAVARIDLAQQLQNYLEQKSFYFRKSSAGEFEKALALAIAQIGAAG